MEYLMTYGWAILIIAVVLVALFRMGVLNSANFAPKAQPGSCQVFKTVEGTSLEGTCNNELPQYVARFDGVDSVITVGNNQNLHFAGPFSVVAWVYMPAEQTSGAPEVINDYNGAYKGYQLYVNSGNIVFFYVGGSSSGEFCASAQTISLKTWYQIVGIYNGIAPNVYVDGVQTSCSAFSPIVAESGTTSIGEANWYNEYFDGSISNIQLYNTSLSANDVAALYYEGIGGAPFDVQNLVGWWPLNGNANDYSGNNNGAATNVIYTGSWTSGYSQP